MNVQSNINGHPSGWKRVRQQVKKDWTCPECGAFARYWWLTCPVCNHPRPQ
jgi:rubrerythrin